MAAPPGGLAILVDEKRVNELLQQKSGLKALLRQGLGGIRWMGRGSAPIDLAVCRILTSLFHWHGGFCSSEDPPKWVSHHAVDLYLLCAICG